MSSVAANRYATALIDALYPHKAELGLQQLQSFASLLTEEPNGRRLLENPAMGGDRRNRLLKEISAALAFDRRVANFITILANRNRLPILEDIIIEYQRLLDKRLGIVRARVTAAGTLDPTQQRALASTLQELTGQQVRMEVTIDPSLIGGVVAQVGSTVYDGSVRQKLQAFKSRLVGE
ncbi:MAG: ATP synthase F1 subunit delta [Acidobacteria bacterium]|nr:MAG: ATP synthase F1 subunit delta [Acidobacteriota bacterium]